MRKSLLISSLIVALAQASVVARGLAANFSLQNTANQSARQTVEMQIESWTDRYVKTFGSNESFSTRVRNHLNSLMLQEDSISFLKNLVDRGALRQGTSIEAYFEEYVHFITWQSLRRLPDSHVPQYLSLIVDLSRGASEELCREFLHNKSTIGFARPLEQLRAISTLSVAEQDQYFRLVDLGFKRLTSGAYPKRRLSKQQVTDLQDSYRLFQRQSPRETGNCEKVRATIAWAQTIEPEATARVDLWLNGLLPQEP